MRKVAALLMVVVACASSDAFGGFVTFVPDTREVLVGSGDIVSFELTATSDGALAGGWDNITFVMGSDDVAFGFEYAPEFNAAFSLVNPPGPFFPVYGVQSTIAGGAVPAPGTLLTSLMLGTVTVDTAGLAEGSYTVGIDAQREIDTPGVGSALSVFGLVAVAEPMSGFGTINVVPEPATISLLGLAALGLIRRRRKSA